MIPFMRLFISFKENIHNVMDKMVLMKKCMKKGLVQAVTGLIVVVVAIMIGALLIGQLHNITLNLNMTDTARNTIDSLFSQTWGAYGLLVIVPIIVVAAVVIGLLGGWSQRK